MAVLTFSRLRHLALLHTCNQNETRNVIWQLMKVLNRAQRCDTILVRTYCSIIGSSRSCVPFDRKRLNSRGHTYIYRHGCDKNLNTGICTCMACSYGMCAITTLAKRVLHYGNAKLGITTALEMKESRNYSSDTVRKFVLGIETSCDDTGAAVVNDQGNVIGEALNSQTAFHTQMGGIIPPFARDLHKKHIEAVVTEALTKSQLQLEDIDAIAVTVKPGLPLSLGIGLNYAKQLVRQSGKPMIPIHHMEAHALTARMLHKIDFPFMVMLASGGHCLLVVARDIDDYLLIGQSLDDAPGEAYDKAARRLLLKNIPGFESLSGGASIEMLAKDGDPNSFEFPLVMMRIPSCDFSFSGLKYHVMKVAAREELKQGTPSGVVLPNVRDICAAFQFSLLRHMSTRLYRAFLYCELKNLLPESKTMVLSGGVASNQYLRSGLEKVCQKFNCELICPPPKLCTDNGIMIAWNGMEKLLAGHGIADDFEAVTHQHRCILGVDIREEVQEAGIKVPRYKYIIQSPYKRVT